MNTFRKKQISPARILAISFFLAIAVGTGLLLLPPSTVTHHISFIDALFTATSAICVTGLIVVDTATYFTGFGQLIIILLIQLGGLGIMTFSSLILLTAGRRVSLSDKMAVEKSFRPSAISDFSTLLRDVFVFTLSIEALGSLILLSRFYKLFSFSRALGLSVFHSISAFCNAGFSLFSDNLVGFRGEVLVNLVIMLLIITGGLGFFVLQETRIAIRNIIKGKRFKFSLHTKLVATVTILIILFGSAIIFLVDYDRGFRQLSLKEKTLASIFHVVSARTAGFNTIDLSGLSIASILILILVMFIGASPGSTGGGVKTTTFGLIFVFLKSRIKGYEVPRVFSCGIKNEDLIKAYTLVSLAIGLIFGSTFAILLLQPEFTLEQVLFEVVSAFGTVGLSLGITPALCSWSKFILVITMYMGRIGPLTMLYAFSRLETAGMYQFVEESVMVG